MAETETWGDIGRDAALDQLRSLRKSLSNEKLWDRVEGKLNDIVDVPMVPESLEGTAFDTIGDAARGAVVGALDELIDELEELEMPAA